MSWFLGIDLLCAIPYPRVWTHVYIVSNGSKVADKQIDA